MRIAKYPRDDSTSLQTAGWLVTTTVLGLHGQTGRSRPAVRSMNTLEEARDGSGRGAERDTDRESQELQTQP